jgi:predicted Zn-dependent peptidase
MDVNVTRLNSGLTVVTEKMPRLESVALGIWIKSGSRNELDSEHGIAHLLEHMAFKGTARRSARDIAEEIENVGGEVNAATSIESTSYYARVLKDDLSLAVDILADILTESLFEEDELEREKNVILQEIGASLDSPDDVLLDNFSAVAFRDQKLGRTILGTPETVQSFRPEQILAAITQRTECSWWPQAMWITTHSPRKLSRSSAACPHHRWKHLSSRRLSTRAEKSARIAT